MARRSCPLEGFEQCDTVPDELKKLNRSFLALFRILADPIKLDLFSTSRFTKHCKWARDDSVETQFLLLCRPSCGIISQLWSRQIAARNVPSHAASSIPANSTVSRATSVYRRRISTRSCAKVHTLPTSCRDCSRYSASTKRPWCGPNRRCYETWNAYAFHANGRPNAVTILRSAFPPGTTRIIASMPRR